MSCLGCSWASVTPSSWTSDALLQVSSSITFPYFLASWFNDSWTSPICAHSCTSLSSPLITTPSMLDSADYVFIREDGHRPPLRSPYRRPFHILERCPKTFLVDLLKQPSAVSKDCCKPVCLPPDFIDSPAHSTPSNSPMPSSEPSARCLDLAPGSSPTSLPRLVMDHPVCVPNLLDL